MFNLIRDDPLYIKISFPGGYVVSKVFDTKSYLFFLKYLIKLSIIKGSTNGESPKHSTCKSTLYFDTNSEIRFKTFFSDPRYTSTCNLFLQKLKRSSSFLLVVVATTIFFINLLF